MAIEIVLNRREHGAYGQDFLFGGGVERIGLRRVVHDTQHGYFVDDVENLRLVVTHNPEDESDARFISGLPTTAAVVAHLHLQLRYLTSSQRRALEMTLSRADAAVLPARFLSDEVARTFPQLRCEVIRYGFDTGRFRPSAASARTRYRAQSAEPGPKVAIVHVGRLEEAKGLQLLQCIAPRVGSGRELWIQYLANTDNDQTRAYATLAGALAEQNCRHVRAIPDADPLSDRPARYADWLLSVSLMEVAPMVVLEGLLCGIPALVTRSTPFFEELVVDSHIDSRWLRVLDLPCDMQRRGPRKRLKLNRSELDGLCKEVAYRISALPAVTDDDRANVRSQALAAGLGIERMLADCRALYDDVEKARGT